MGNLLLKTDFSELLGFYVKKKKDEFQVESILVHFPHEFTICGFMWVFLIKEDLVLYFDS